MFLRISLSGCVIDSIYPRAFHVDPAAVLLLSAADSRVFLRWAGREASMSVFLGCLGIYILIILIYNFIKCNKKCGYITSYYFLVFIKFHILWLNLHLLCFYYMHISNWFDFSYFAF